MVRRSADSEEGVPIERRPLLKLAGAAAGASFVGGSLVETASASTADHDGVQVDFVTGFAPNEDLGSTTYSSEGRLVNWEWGERYGATGEDMDKEPKTDTLDVSTTSGVEFDFSSNTATVNYTLSGSGGDQDLLLVAYDSPISDPSNPGWDPSTASDQSIYDYAHVSTQSDGSLTVDIPAADVPTSVTNHWRVNEGSGLTLGDAVGSLDATASSPTNLSWSSVGGLDGAHIQSSADTASGADLGSGSTTALSHFLQGNGTIGAWVYLDSGELSSRRTILSSGRATTNSIFLGTATNGSDLNLTINAGGSTVVDLNFGSSTFTAGAWHPVAITCDGSTARAYVDGGEVASASLSNTAPNNLASSVQLGTDPGTSNTSWVGGLDDVWISNTAASARDVNAWGGATENNYPPATENVEAYYSLDGSTATNDVTGADATEYGTPDSGAEGIRGSAFSFDRSNDEALSSGQNLDLGGAGVTVAAWVNFTEYDDYARLYQTGAGISSAGATSTGGFETLFRSGTDGDNINVVPESTSGTPLIDVEPDAWYFVVTVLDGSNTRLHVFDRTGELDASPVSGGDSRSTTSGVPLTLMAGGTENFTSGRMDEVYAYNTDLSETEVTDLYAASEPVGYGSVPQGSLEAHYPFDGSDPSSATNLLTGTDATVTGAGPTAGADGIRGDAFDFPTSGSAPPDALTSGTNLALNGSSATVAAWFKFTGHETFGRVFQVGGAIDGLPSSGYDLEFDGGNDDLNLVLWDGGSTNSSTISVSPNTWYFAVAVVGGSNSDGRLHLFDRDSELTASPVTVSGARGQSGDEPLHIGAGGNDGSELEGTMDEVRGYSRALSTEEVERLHRVYSGTVGDQRVETPYGLNAGTTTADSRVTIDGLEFANGQGPFVDSTVSDTVSTGDSIDTSNVNNSAGALYGTQVASPAINYDLDVLNGTYDVTVHTAEVEYTASGERTFDISVDGTTIETDLDIYDEVGHDAAYTTSATGVAVKDGSLTVSTGSGSSTSSTSPPSGSLEAYYSLDGSTATNGETSTDASVTGDPQSGVGGALNSAFDFDGNDALTSRSNLPLNGSAATVGAWVRFTTHDDWARIYQVGGSTSSAAANDGAYETLFISDTNDIRVATSANNTAATGLSLSPETWHFVVTVVDGTSVRLHVFDFSGEVNGSPVTGTGSRSTSQSSKPLVMMAGGSSNFTTGRMDEVRAYSQALSESDVTTLYQASKDRPGVISGIEVRPS